MILELSGKFPVNMLCEEMGINRSSFYYWKEHLSKPAPRTKSLVSAIALFQEYHLKFPSHGYRWLNAKIRLPARALRRSFFSTFFDAEMVYSMVARESHGLPKYFLKFLTSGRLDRYEKCDSEEGPCILRSS